MATNCVSILRSDIKNDCTETYKKGVKGRIWIVPEESIDQDTVTFTGNLVSIPKLKTGVTAKGIKAYDRSKQPFNVATEDQNAEDGTTSFNKTVPVYLRANNADNAQKVLALKENKYWVIVECNGKQIDGKPAFEVVGAEQGAQAQNANKEVWGDEGGGGWTLDMVEEEAPTPAVFLTVEDAATTIAALDSLCYDATPSE